LKLVTAILAIITGLFLISAIGDFPNWGDPESPANSYVSSYYVEHAMDDSNVPNVVTAVLADYRAFDTMFETAVVFVALISIAAILRVTRKDLARKKETVTKVYHPKNSLITKVASRLMIPYMQLFSLYVVAHGHHSPGGGFQGGVILGASLILFAMAYDLKTALKRLKEKTFIILSAVGVLIFAGIGALCVFLGGNFLDYSALHVLLPSTDAIMARSHSMLGVEIGVAITVMCGMFSIYAHLSSNGTMKEGL
jgi:multicomponent Na+:H+ antiporter subunit B